MNKIQALLRQLDVVSDVLTVCVQLEQARLTEHYYTEIFSAYQNVSLAEKKLQVKNACSSNE